jgi:GrpB-like predicted nucleotidyltransferase (UPF0157 family)
MTAKTKQAVKIVPYDGEAPKIFQKIKNFIRDAIPYQIQIEHIGSTAVKGLGGREIIDVLIIAKREHMEEIAKLLESKGYSNPRVASPERLFVSGPYKYKERELHIHIHITFFGSKEQKEKLLFRDYLRSHPEEAEVYYKLKKEWSKKAASDASKYSSFKTAYIKRVLAKAKS